MNVFARFRSVMKVMGRRKRPMEAMPLLRTRPAILMGVNLFEMSLLASGAAPVRVKALAQIKTSSLVGCPF